MNKIPKIYIIIGVAVLLAVLLLSIRNCSNNSIDDQNVISAVAQSKIDALVESNTILTNQNKVHQNAIDSLRTIIKAKDNRIASLNTRVATIALNYEKEKARLKLLPDDSAVAEFLDNAECGEQLIMKYDSLYLIDICPIRTYNDIRIGFDMQVDVNQILREKLGIQSSKNADLEGIIIVKDKQIASKDTIISNNNLVVAEKDNQIKAEHKKYKQQKVITWVTGGVGIVLLTLSLLR